MASDLTANAVVDASTCFFDQTLVSAAITIASAWGVLHLAYVSDALYEAGLVALPASVAWQSVPFAWLWHYIAANGWAVGVVLYVPVWLAAALARAMRQRPNNSCMDSPCK